MRTADEILKEARRDIQTREYKTDAPLWLEYLKIEVLIDLRDLHAEILYALKTYILHERGKQ